MENIVWAIFGILAFLIAIGILIGIAGTGFEERKEAMNKNAIKEFGQACKYVCGSDIETRLSDEIEISSGAVVSSDSGNICLEYRGERDCVDCTCDLNSFNLNLNRPELLSAYDTHVFDCAFERVAGGRVLIDCTG